MTGRIAPKHTTHREDTSDVSTLTPAEAGVHHERGRKDMEAEMFQRSPRPKPGCIRRADWPPSDTQVSTLTPAEAGVHPLLVHELLLAAAVSTLTPAEAGVHQRLETDLGNRSDGFNAHPGRSRGASITRIVMSWA